MKRKCRICGRRYGDKHNDRHVAEKLAADRRIAEKIRPILQAARMVGDR